MIRLSVVTVVNAALIDRRIPTWNTRERPPDHFEPHPEAFRQMNVA